MDLNKLGLVMNIFGAIILLFFNFPVSRIDPPRLVVKRLSDEEESWNKKVNHLAYIGLLYMILGFIYQLIYTY